MAVTYTPLDVEAGYNRNRINQNFSDIQGSFQDALSRNGGTPNNMLGDLDMDSNSVINLPTPTLATEAVNKAYVDARSFDATLGTVITNAAAAALVSETNAAASESAAAASAAAADVDKIVWMGLYSSLTTYSKNDAVGLNGASYISVADSNMGNTPVVGTNTAFWHVLAERGIDGSNGTGAVDSVSAGTGLTLTGTGTDPILGITVPINIALGGTGATDAPTARTNLGLGSAAVEDTSAFLQPDVTSNLTIGYTNTSHDYGTITTGTLTVDFTESPQAQYVNDGAHTLAPDVGVEGAQDILVTNGSSAGTIVTSGWDVIKGDTLTVTDGDKFLLQAKSIAGVDILFVSALQ